MLQRKRILFFCSILKMRGNLQSSDSNLPAELLGRVFAWKSEQLDNRGVPTPTANPWLRMYYADVVAYVNQHPLPDWTSDVREWTSNPAFMNCRFAQQLSNYDLAEMPRHEAMVHVEAPTPCTTCDKMLQNKRGLTVHRTQTHLKNSDATRRMRMLTMTNACPWCAYQVSTKRSLRDHIRTRDWR